VVGEQYYLNQQMTFSNCSPLVIAPPEHPLVHVDNWRQNYGTGGYDSLFRSKSGDLFSSFSQARRVWTFNPKDTANWYQTSSFPVVKLTGETNTSQFLYAWLFDDAVAGGAAFSLVDKSLPTSGNIRIRIKAKAKNTGGQLMFSYMGNGSSAWTTVALSTSAWTIYETIIPCPAEWKGSRNGGANLGPGISLFRLMKIFTLPR
jgi:hypothetical protein